jgi:hypothetical protein
LVWPVVSRVLHGGAAPSARDQQVVDLLDNWVRRDAPLEDANNDLKYDEASPAIMQALWRPIADAVMGRVFKGKLLGALDDVRGLDGFNGQSYVDKDLRTLLGQRVKGKFHLRYCGGGSLKACRASLWAAVHQSVEGLATKFGDPDPTHWIGDAGRTGFVPNLIPTTFRSTNRPTFQQVLEFQRGG